MSFDMEKWHSPAEQHMVAGVSVELAVALNAVYAALKKLGEASEIDLSEELQDIREVSKGMSDRFKDLTGYTEDEHA